jgi:arginyl-tRNA synthetase
MLNYELQNYIHAAIVSLFSNNDGVKEFLADTGAKIEYPKDRKFGDYSTPVAMQLTKILKKNPFEIAELIAGEIKKADAYSKVDVVKPGFINIFLSDKTLFDELSLIIKQKNSYSKPEAKDSKIIFEYVSANPTGPLHIGHARWAALGDTLSRMLTWAGYEVYREFYVNDAGVQVENLNKTVNAIRNNLEIPEDGYHGEYVKECLDYNGEPIDYFLTRQKETLSAFRVKFDNYFSEKKELHDKNLVEKTAALLKEKGLSYENEGATWFKSTDFGDDKDRVLVKTDGKFTYFTPDIAYHKTKIDRGFDRIINFFGADHHGYIKRIKAAVKALSEREIGFDILIGQLVFLFRNGEPVKLSKRTGNIITLREVMEEIGVDAMRYFLTMRKADTPFDFDLEIAKKSTSDNPVFYIQYAFARINSILRNAEEKGIVSDSNFTSQKLSDAERDLAVKILKYPEEIVDAANSLEPHRVTNYLYDTATLFHKFYEKCRVIDEENKDITKMRLFIVLAVKECLNTLLGLLGIDAPERM